MLRASRPRDAPMGAPRPYAAAMDRSSLEMGDRPDDFLPYGVMICALVGAIGGLFGQYAAWIRAFIATLRQ